MTNVQAVSPVKRFLILTALSVLCCLLLPFFTVRFVPGDSGMAVCLLLFYAVDPLCAVVIGIHAGRCIKRLWFLPGLHAALFIAGAWLCFDAGETAFVHYAGWYLVIGGAAMLLAAFLHSRKQP